MTPLEGFQANLESLPKNLQRKYALIRDLDKSLQETQRQNEQRCEQEMQDIKHRINSGNITLDASFNRFSDEALDEQKHCIRIADEKVAIAVQAYDLVDTNIQQLDQYLRKFDEELRQERERAGAIESPASDVNGSMKFRRGSESRRGGRKKSRGRNPMSMDLDLPVDPNEPTYCLCNQVSFGEMVACDNPDCKIEWFHYGCVGLKEQPKGKWYCSECVLMRRKAK